MSILVLGVLLLCCSGDATHPPPSTTPTLDPLTLDQDGDGYSPLEGDCDDLDRDIS